jgi:hypothetical protein
VQNTTRWDGEDHYDLDQRQKGFERHAVKLAAAWSDFDVAEQAAIEIIRRFGAIEARNFGVMRLHKHPLFAALQTACVISYTRPFAGDNGIERISPKFTQFSKPEWQEFHEELFIWRDYLSGDRNFSSREFVVARDAASKGRVDRFVIGEASAVLEPSKDFTLLREMCADRKALLWPDLQDAISTCYPGLYNPVLLSLGGPVSLL